jgi:hypothetical protein
VQARQEFFKEDMKSSKSFRAEVSIPRFLGLAAVVAFVVVGA